MSDHDQRAEIQRLTDIVERLLERARWHEEGRLNLYAFERPRIAPGELDQDDDEKLHLEAAAAIERLCVRLTDQDTEIERLRGELQACGLDNEAYFNRCEQQAAEIERLRALKTPASRELLNITKAALDHAEDEIERLRVELARWERGENLLQKTIKEIYDKPREMNK